MWAEVGKECICINENGEWLKFASAIDFLFGIATRFDGPHFMQILKITAVEAASTEQPGHEIKLHFAEFPGEHYCVCQFRPLEKLEDEQEDRIYQRHRDTEKV